VVQNRIRSIARRTISLIALPQVIRLEASRRIFFRRVA